LRGGEHPDRGGRAGRADRVRRGRPRTRGQRRVRLRTPERIPGPRVRGGLRWAPTGPGLRRPVHRARRRPRRADRPGGQPLVHRRSVAHARPGPPMDALGALRALCDRAHSGPGRCAWHDGAVSTEPTFYEAVGGEPTFRKLVDTFYAGVADDPVLRPIYPEEDLGPAAERLRMFLEQYWGGPKTYSEQRGHPRLRRRHAPFRVGPRRRH